SGIAYGQDFVEEQNFRFEVRRDRKCQAHIHAAAVSFDRRIDKSFKLREGDDLVEFAGDFAAAHAQDRTVGIDIFAAREFGMESCSDFEQAADPSADLHPPSRRFGDAGEYFEQSAFSSAVAPDDADDLARFYLKADLRECPEVRFSSSVPVSGFGE